MPRKRKGPPYRRIVTTFWTDPEVLALPRADKAVAAYLFSNRHSHPCGVYLLHPIYLQHELGLDILDFEELIGGPLASLARYDWDTEEIFVRSMARYQIDGGLYGKDKRIGWVVAQLETIRSLELVRAFRHHQTYRTWNLDLSHLIPGDVPGPLGIPHMDTEPDSSEPQNAAGIYTHPSEPAPSLKREGASHGPSPDTSADRTADTGENGAVERKGKGHGKGHGKPVPAPVPDPGPEAIQPPAPSSESAKGAGGENIVDSPGEQRDRHPELDRLWTGGAKQAVLEVWHRGEERVHLETTSVGVGLEYWLLNDLLHFNGDPEVVAYMIAHAPARLGWDTEPRSLHWLLRAENYLAAERLALEDRAPPLATFPVDVKLRTMPAVSAADIEDERRRAGA